MNTDTDNADYRQRLKLELEQRLSLNPRYSLRAFARDLGISPSRLSHVLKGKFGLSESAGEGIAAKLGLNATETGAFVNSISAQHGRSGIRRETARRRLESLRKEITELTADSFMLIS